MSSSAASTSGQSVSFMLRVPVLNFVYRGSLHRRKSAVCPQFDMLWLNRSPIPVGRRGVISSLKKLLPAIPRVEDGEGGVGVSTLWFLVEVESVQTSLKLLFTSQK